MANEIILIFCAHSDDEAVGMGGTIAKLSRAGKKIIKVVMSYGELSKPHFKKEIIIAERIRETEKAGKFIGIKKTIFLGLRDAKVKEDIRKPENVKMIKNIILHYSPKKVFLPSAQDPHPDHQAVYNEITKILGSLKKKIHIYAFEVWNVLTEEKPAIYEDITDYFDKKIKYIKMFRSQWFYMYLLLVPAYFRARKYGRRIGVRYAEKFYRVM